MSRCVHNDPAKGGIVDNQQHASALAGIIREHQSNRAKGCIVEDQPNNIVEGVIAKGRSSLPLFASSMSKLPRCKL